MGLRKKKKDKKKKIEEVVKEKIEEPVIEPEPIQEPEPIPVPPPPPKPVLPDGINMLWKSVTLETKEQIVDLFNGIESKGFTVVDFDFEYTRNGLVEVVYKVKRVG